MVRNTICNVLSKKFKENPECGMLKRIGQMNTLCFCEGKVFCLICSGSIACFKVIKCCVTLQFTVQRKV
jgi:hypothetical protein